MSVFYAPLRLLFFEKLHDFFPLAKTYCNAYDNDALHWVGMILLSCET